MATYYKLIEVSADPLGKAGTFEPDPEVDPLGICKGNAGDMMVKEQGAHIIVPIQEFKQHYFTREALIDYLGGAHRPPLRSPVYARVQQALRGHPKTTKQVEEALPDVNPRSLGNLLRKGSAMKLWHRRGKQWVVSERDHRLT